MDDEKSRAGLAKKVQALDSDQDIQGPQTMLRGHMIEFDGEEWVYTDDKSSTVLNWEGRLCGHCGLPFTEEGHDGCLGTLPGVMNACCGHGNVAEAYVQDLDGTCLDGAEAVRKIEELKAARCALAKILDHLLHDLQDRAHENLGEYQWVMYREGVWTGYLNVLNRNSPRCVKNESEAFEWYSQAIDYLEQYMLAYPLGTGGKDERRTA
jgi:hypothetical protein